MQFFRSGAGSASASQPAQIATRTKRSARIGAFSLFGLQLFRRRTMTNQILATIALFAIWLVVLPILWVTWEMSEREFRWWVTAIYAGVIGVASFLSIKLFPYKPGNENSRQ